MTPIGVDEWVARSGDRRERLGGPLGRVTALYERVGWWPRLALLAALGVGFGLIGPNGFQQTVAFNSVMYAILAVGLNIVVGWTGLLDLGYVAFYGVGAYGYAMFSSHALGSLLTMTGGVELSTVATVPIVVVFAGIVGVLIGLVALRLHGDYLAIVTLFFGLAFYEFVNNVDQTNLGGNNGIVALNPFHAFGASISSTIDYYYAALILLLLLMAGLRMLNTSRTGRAWRAVRDDHLAAQAMTIPVNRVKVLAFAFGAMVAAAAGTLFAAQQGNVFPTNFTTQIVITIYACLVLGGVGNLSGAVLGGVLVTVMQQLLASPTDAGYLFYGLILLGLIWKVRPWQHLLAMFAAIVAFGFALRGIAGAISHTATDGATGSVGWIGSAMRHFVLVPSHNTTYGNILFALLICAVLGIQRLRGIWRLAAIVPTVYFAACCWESRLSLEPAITAQIALGIILIAVMASRPHGILGTHQLDPTT